MITKKRIGSCVPVENVDPHTGSFLDYGIIIGWRNSKNAPCPRKNAVVAIIETSGRKFADWDEWAEEHAWELCPFPEEVDE